MIATSKICSLLKKNNIIISNDLEKVHIIIVIVDNYCHDVVYHKHDLIDYKILKEEVINTIKSILF